MRSFFSGHKLLSNCYWILQACPNCVFAGALNSYQSSTTKFTRVGCTRCDSGFPNSLRSRRFLGRRTQSGTCGRNNCDEQALAEVRSQVEVNGVSTVIVHYQPQEDGLI